MVNQSNAAAAAKDDYLYLVDAKDQRQYAIRLDGNGRVDLGDAVVFSQDKKSVHVLGNETIFAFDDKITFQKDHAGRTQLVTHIYQLDTGADKQLIAVKSAPVTFDVSFTPFGLNYTMTDDSVIRLIADEGFDHSVRFNNRYFLRTGKNKRALRNGMGEQVLPAPSMPFPPHHPDGVAVVHENVMGIGGRGGSDDPNKGSNGPQNSGNRGNNPSSPPGPPPKYKISDRDLENTFDKYCDDLTKKAMEGSLDPVIGRDSETDQAMRVLSRRKQASLCFTGEPGVGKTAMFSAVASRIVRDENVPDSLRGARVMQVDLQAMNAGAMMRGQFEERLKPLVEGLKERGGMFKGQKIILAIDEIHSQLSAGAATGAENAGNIMKPFLTSKGISVMGATTADEYRQYIEKDSALASRFEQLVLGSPSPQATKEILDRLWPLYRDHHGITKDLTEEDFDYIVTMSNRYAPNEHQPRKSEKVLDMACAAARFRGSMVVEHQDIIAAVAQMSKLSINFLNQSDHERFLRMEKEVPNEVMGQPGIQRVIDGLVGSRSGLNDPNQPWGCFVFQGPTGTGKTELAKSLARYLFGSEDSLIKLDMSEYSEKFSISRLIGAPPGYVGFDDASPALTEKIRQQPYSILLLDEVEKAHPDVFNVLLSVLNDGKMTDNKGNTVLFNNVIIVMTTNAGAKTAMDALQSGSKSMAIGSNQEKNVPKDPKQVEAMLDKIYARSRKEVFPRPEMINRIEELGGFITFVPLERDVIASLVDREVGKVEKRINSQTGAALKNIQLVVTDNAKEALVEKGYNPAMGARPLRKAVRENISNPLGKWLMAHKEEVEKFVEQNGSAKITIDSLTAFEPKLTVGDPPVPVNDNDKAVTGQNKKPAAPPHI